MAAPYLQQGRQLPVLLKLHSSLNTVSGAAKAFSVCAAISRAIAGPVRSYLSSPVQTWLSHTNIAACEIGMLARVPLYRCKQLNASKELQRVLLSESRSDVP